MVKRQKQKSGGTAGKKDSATVELHFLWQASLVAGAALASLNATGLGSLTTRFLSIGDAYAYFRYVRFKFRLFPNGTRSAAQLAGFVPVVDTSPTTAGQAGELLSSVPLGINQTTPSEWVNVPHVDLAGPFPWYMTIDGTPDSTEEYPGRLVVIGGGTDGFTMEVRATVTLKEGVAPANTPEELELIVRHRALRQTAMLDRARSDVMRVLTQGKTAVSTPLRSSQLP